MKHIGRRAMWRTMFTPLVLGVAAMGVARSAHGQVTGRAWTEANQAERHTVTHSAPSGWLGVWTQQDSIGVNQWALPVIMSVEPGSPAQQAGLLAGDTIIKYDKVDGREPFRTSIVPYLVPNRKLAVRYRRNGVKETTIIVGKRPPAMSMHFEIHGDSTQSFNVTVDDSKGQVQIEIAQQILGILTPMLAGDQTVAAGAHMTRMNEGLASALGVGNTGVFVVDVMPNTPATQAGLQGGDIITSVGKTAVSDPTEIVQALVAKQRAKNRVVSLGVLRKGKNVRVDLKVPK